MVTIFMVSFFNITCASFVFFMVTCITFLDHVSFFIGASVLFHRGMLSQDV
jgi:hypothetical protein